MILLKEPETAVESANFLHGSKVITWDCTCCIPTDVFRKCKKECKYTEYSKYSFQNEYLGLNMLNYCIFMQKPLTIGWQM